MSDMVSFNVKVSTTTLDMVALRRSVLSPTNRLLVRDLQKRGKGVERVAKKFVGVRTGVLKKSITSKVIFYRGVPRARIGSSTVRYALVHHRGSRAHIIKGRRGRNLHFLGKRGWVTTPAVNHPGTKANRYLTNALLAEGYRPSISRTAI